MLLGFLKQNARRNPRACDDSGYQDVTNYTPIDCSLHDRLESMAELGTEILLVYAVDGASTRRSERIADVFTRGQEEFVRLAPGIEIRMDPLISVDGVPFIA